MVSALDPFVLSWVTTTVSALQQHSSVMCAVSEGRMECVCHRLSCSEVLWAARRDLLVTLAAILRASVTAMESKLTSLCILVL